MPKKQDNVHKILDARMEAEAPDYVSGGLEAELDGVPQERWDALNKIGEGELNFGPVSVDPEPQNNIQNKRDIPPSVQKALGQRYQLESPDYEDEKEQQDKFENDLMKAMDKYLDKMDVQPDNSKLSVQQVLDQGTELESPDYEDEKEQQDAFEDGLRNAIDKNLDKAENQKLTAEAERMERKEEFQSRLPEEGSLDEAEDKGKELKEKALDNPFSRSLYKKPSQPVHSNAGGSPSPQSVSAFHQDYKSKKEKLETMPENAKTPAKEVTWRDRHGGQPLEDFKYIPNRRDIEW